MAYTPVLSKREWPFTPQCLPNCVLWLDAADTSTYSTASFVSWRNKGFAGGSTSGTTGTITATTINGVPALSLAVGAFTIAPSTTYTQTTRTIFTVTNNIPTNLQVNIALGLNTKTPILGVRADNLLYFGNTSPAFIKTSSSVSSLVFSPCICYGSSSIIAINGNSLAITGTSPISFATGTATNNDQQIGNSANTGSFTLGEVLIFDGELTDIQRQQVEGYLAIKWKLQSLLPATHPYFSPIIQSPTQISGCLLWLDGADASTITQGIQPDVPPGNPPVITNWADKSGKSSYTVGSLTVFDATGQNFSSDYIYPKYDSLSKSAVFTNHSGFHTSLTTGVNSQNHCLIAVHKPTTDNCLFGFSSNFTFPPYQSKYSTPALSLACTSSTSSINIIIANIANNVQTIYLNGTVVSSGTSTLSSTTTTDLYIGNTGWDVRDGNNNLVNTAATFYRGNLYELIVYQTALTTTQIMYVNSYLSNKWAVSLSSPTTPIYANISNRPFQPVDIAGCALWLDGMDRSSMDFSGSTISQWKDKSGNGYNATVAPSDTDSTYTATATYSTDPIGVYFPDKYTAYKTEYPANPTSETAFVVARNPNPSVNNNITVGGPRGARSISFGYHSTAANSCAYLNNAIAWLSNTGVNSYDGTTAMVTGIIRPSGSNSSCTIAIKGGAMSTAVDGTFVAGTITCIGADTYNANNQFHYIGYIMEIIFYNRILSKSEILQVESHLSQKWNINSSLATTHPGYYLPAYSTTFTPKAITGLQLWLDAADMSTITGNPVTAWADKSGNGNNATAVGTPTGTITLSTQSGNQYMNLNGTAGFNGSISITGTQVTSFAVIIMPTNPPITNRIVSLGVTTAADYNNSSYVASIFTYANTSASDITTYRVNVSGSVTLPNEQSNTPRIAASIYDGANGYLYRNGVSSSGFASTGTFGISAYGIGKDVNAVAEIFTGYIGEVLIYNTALTTTQRQQVEGYLVWKWGTASSLPSTHPYAKFSP